MTLLQQPFIPYSHSVKVEDSQTIPHTSCTDNGPYAGVMHNHRCNKFISATIVQKTVYSMPPFPMAVTFFLSHESCKD